MEANLEKEVYFVNAIKAGKLRVTKSGKVFGARGKEIGSLSKDGYVLISLVVAGTCYTMLAHRLIYIWFKRKGKPFKKDVLVNHKDCKRNNNRLSNLEKCSDSYNKKYGYAVGYSDVKGIKNSQVKLTEEQVRAIRNLSQAYPAVFLAELFGITRQRVYQIRSGKAWTHI